jgi:hypothetical protein
MDAFFESVEDPTMPIGVDGAPLAAGGLGVAPPRHPLRGRRRRGPCLDESPALTDDDPLADAPDAPVYDTARATVENPW